MWLQTALVWQHRETGWQRNCEERQGRETVRREDSFYIEERTGVCVCSNTYTTAAVVVIMLITTLPGHPSHSPVGLSVQTGVCPEAKEEE